MTVVLRPAERRDLPEVSALLDDTWHATYDTIYGRDRVAEITARWHSVETLALGLDREDVSFLVAVDSDGRVVGTASIRPEADGAAMLDRLYVSPSVQGGGVGSALLDAALAAFPHATVVRLEVEPANVAAVDYYERRGFRTTSRTDDCGSTGDGIPAIVMTLNRNPGSS